MRAGVDQGSHISVREEERGASHQKQDREGAGSEFSLGMLSYRSMEALVVRVPASDVACSPREGHHSDSDLTCLGLAVRQH
jgi:hypothetical protein